MDGDADPWDYPPEEESRPDFDAEQVAALRRLVDATREMNELVSAASGSAQTLGDLAARVEGLVAELRPSSGERPLPRFWHADEGRKRLNRLLPYSMVTGRYNPIAPPIHLTVEGEKVVGRHAFGEVYGGPPHSVHGGMIAAAWDQILAIANLFVGKGGPTAYLTVHYRRPTPLNEEIRFEAWVDRVEGRKVFTEGACYAGDELLSQAEGLFVLLEPRKAAGHWKRKKK